MAKPRGGNQQADELEGLKFASLSIGMSAIGSLPSRPHRRISGNDAGPSSANQSSAEASQDSRLHQNDLD